MPEFINEKTKKASGVAFWFKYFLSIYVVTLTIASSLDGKLSTEEIQNGAIIIGIWATSEGKEKEKEKELEEEIDEISDKVDILLAHKMNQNETN
jgi:hypothetical protein